MFLGMIRKSKLMAVSAMNYPMKYTSTKVVRDEKTGTIQDDQKPEDEYSIVFGRIISVKSKPGQHDASKTSAYEVLIEKRCEFFEPCIGDKIQPCCGPFAQRCFTIAASVGSDVIKLDSSGAIYMAQAYGA